MLEKDFCVNHPDREAIEHCEVCGKPLCGYCLWYTSDGQRLCENHATQAKSNDVEIIPPAMYAQGIIPSQAGMSQKTDFEEDGKQKRGLYDKRQVIYQGNNTDLQAFVSMLIGIIMLGLCCAGASYCLPFLGFLLGVLGFINAKDAVDKSRARQHALIAIATNGVFVGGFVCCIAGYILFYGAVFTSINTINYTPVVWPTNTATPRIVPSSTAPSSDQDGESTSALEPVQLTATAESKSAGTDEDRHLEMTPTPTPTSP